MVAVSPDELREDRLRHRAPRHVARAHEQDLQINLMSCRTGTLASSVTTRNPAPRISPAVGQPSVTAPVPTAAPRASAVLR